MVTSDKILSVENYEVNLIVVCFKALEFEYYAKQLFESVSIAICTKHKHLHSNKDHLQLM